MILGITRLPLWCLPFLLATRLLLASPVAVDDAQQVAAAKLSTLPGSNGFQIVETNTFTDHLLQFFICRTVPQGYLVISGDTELPPVIAFSLDNDFGTISIEHNPLLSLLATDLRTRMNNLDLLTMTIRNERQQQWAKLLSSDQTARDDRTEWWPPEGSTPTGGWIETNWTQSHPYNAFCPIDLASGNRSIAGCPSVAMAQILNFHRTLLDTRLQDWDDYHHNYAGNDFWIDDDHEEYEFISFPVLNGYLDSLELHWEQEQPLTNDDKAALVFACGVACQQVYNPSGSGTFGVGQAYSAFLRFNHPEVRLLDEDDLDLYPTMSLNMMNALPVHLAVVTPQWDMGHNVVLDGYNSEDYYHINFGWGGSYNGWYLLPDEIPYGLTVVEGAICDIGWDPSTVGEPVLAEDFSMNCFPNPCNPVTTISFQLNRSAVVNLAVFDLQGRQVEVVFNGSLGTGQHSVRWEPVVASGIYFVRIDTGNAVEVAKVCVVK
jgi:hypothetical protein